MTEFSRQPDQVQTLGCLELAYVGDSVYELLVRTHLARKGDRVGQLHEKSVAFVSAPAQAEAGEKLMPFLTEEELRVFQRARNAHVHNCPSGSTLAQYHAATALEALFGWLWLTGDRKRIQQLFARIVEESHAP